MGVNQCSSAADSGAVPNFISQGERSLRVKWWQNYPCVSSCVCVWKCTCRCVRAHTLVKSDCFFYLFVFSAPWRPYLDNSHKWNVIRSLTRPRLVNKIIAWFVVKKANWKTRWVIFLPVPLHVHILEIHLIQSTGQKWSIAGYSALYYNELIDHV